MGNVSPRAMMNRHDACCQEENGVFYDIKSPPHSVYRSTTTAQKRLTNKVNEQSLIFVFLLLRLPILAFTDLEETLDVPKIYIHFYCRERVPLLI